MTRTSASTTPLGRSGGGARDGSVTRGGDDDGDDEDVYASLERRYADEDGGDDNDDDEDMDDSMLSDEERVRRLMSPNPVDHVFVEGSPLERKKRERELAYARYHNLKQYVEESLAALRIHERADVTPQSRVWRDASDGLDSRTSRLLL